MPTSSDVQTAPFASALLDRLRANQAQVGIIGLGYVGLPLGLLFSAAKFPVTGFDIDPVKVQTLEAGNSYIHSIPATAIQQARERGFRTTSDFTELSQMEAIVICVPTPLSEHREPDMSYIVATAEAVARHLREGQLVVLESTTYPGTTVEVLVPVLERLNSVALKAGTGNEHEPGKFWAAFSPEREDPGNRSVAREDIPKVVGGLGPHAAALSAALYGAIFRRVVPVSSPAVAEMSKLLENIYRCVNIALVNELKLLCLRMGVDIWEVIQAASSKPFGFQPFYPGPGLGGHCIPIDPFYLSWKARQWDFHTRFIELAGEINSAMPYHVIASVTTALNEARKPVKGSKVLVLGVAYKRDVDDLRESPALTIIELLRDAGAEVSYHDPFFPRVGSGRKYNLQMERVPLAGFGTYDCVLIVTDHSEYDYRQIVAEAKLVVDTRNATKGIQASNIVRC